MRAILYMVLGNLRQMCLLARSLLLAASCCAAVSKSRGIAGQSACTLACFQSHLLVDAASNILRQWAPILIPFFLKQASLLRPYRKKIP